ncbi:MAG: hypothetical protein AAB353_11340 [Candidatus Hydrogenedentota bacterium]
MRMKIIATIFWEQWRCTFRGLIAATGLSIATCIAAYIYLQRYGAGDALYYNSIARTASAGILFGSGFYILYFLFAFGDESDLQLSMPAYLLRLPIGSLTLVLCRMAYGLASVAIIGFAGTLTFYALFGPEMEAHLPFGEVVLGFLIVFAFVQSAAWCVGPGGVGLTVFTLVSVSVLLQWRFFDFEFSSFDRETYPPYFPALLVAFGVAFSWAGVALHRHGRLAFLEEVGSYLPSIRRGGRNRELIFESPEQALRWYENRRQARLLPAMVLFITLAVVAVAIGSDYENITSGDFGSHPDSVFRAMYSQAAFMGAYAALGLATLITSGIFLAQNYRALMRPISIFLFNLPVPTDRLASARFLPLLRATALAVAPLVLAVVIYVLLVSLTGERFTLSWLFDRYSVLEGLGIGALLLIAAYASVWSVIWFGNAFAVLIVYGVSIIILTAGNDFTPDRGEFALQLTAVVVLSASTVLFVRARQLGFLNPRRLLMALAAMPIAGAGFLTLMNFDNLANGNAFDFHYLTYAVPALIALPVLPIVTTPLAMHWARHR